MKNIFSVLLFLIICWFVRPQSYCETHMQECYGNQIQESQSNQLTQAVSNIKIQANDTDTILCMAFYRELTDLPLIHQVNQE